MLRICVRSFVNSHRDYDAWDEIWKYQFEDEEKTQLQNQR